jgi:acyl carrier protein
MEANEVLSRVSGIFRTVTGNQDILLTPESNVDSVEGWDSFVHIRLILAIEKHFNLKFNTFEIQSWKNIGDLCDAVSQKLPSGDGKEKT